MLKIAVLVSGGGTNLQAIIDAVMTKQLPKVQIGMVISSAPTAFALERAQKCNIKTTIVSKKQFSNPSDQILKLLNENKIALVVLAGYLGILNGCILDEYKNKIINIHPALLPKFGGVGMYGHHVHEAVINAHESVSGCSVHYVTANIDGGKIILQKQVPVLPNDTPGTLAARVLIQEHLALVQVLKKLSK
ncbi:phosphoribosylglycinamide formyltransferase [Bacilli bacterium]|nr:phosphoribosylglycinamide formyltransferase [Bacilli bacterium]